jgi:uncharacterized membrane protein HdeD (DUF308 family)
VRIPPLLSLVVGVVMLGLGAYVALHPLWAPARPLTSSRWVDGAFAFFFLLRGMLYVRAALRDRRRAGDAPPDPR